MDNEPIGKPFATAIADYLEECWYFAHSHRDYCGVGFAWIKEEDSYYYTHFYDGYPRLTKSSPPAYDDYLKKFGDRPSFINWLAAQTTATLIGSPEAEWHITNQPMTKDRLEQIIHPDCQD